MINPNKANGIGSTLKRASRRLRLPAIGRSKEKAGQSWPTKSAQQTYSIATQQRSNRAAASDIHPFQEIMGSGTSWARPEYGSYYASSVSVYSAIKLRADAVSRPAARLLRRDFSGEGSGGRDSSSAAVAKPGQSLVHPRRPLAGYRNLPQSVGFCLLGFGSR